MVDPTGDTTLTEPVNGGLQEVLADGVPKLMEGTGNTVTNWLAEPVQPLPSVTVTE